MLNTDYKIFTRALTTKLSKYAPKIIHTDQAGFMQGRRIDDQTELVNLLINMCEVEEINGVVVCLDQEKAYDKITHRFLWDSLEAFNFPPAFINTVKSLYKDAYTTVIINGVRSKPFQVTRGVRQGDPLSCLLFNIAIESLASMLRESTLKGFKIDGHDRIIASLFADDTTVYLSEDDDFSELQGLLAKWCKASGAKFNVQKTEVIPAGSQAYRTRVIMDRRLNNTHPPIPDNIHIAQDGEPVRVLGAYLGNKIDQSSVWAPTLEKLASALNRWERGHPTQDGRRLIIGMEVAGRTQYLARVQGMPEEIETNLKKKIIRFMWGPSDTFSPTVRETMFFEHFQNGGKKLLDISARNEAIELMKLKVYLQPASMRPRWTAIADILIKRNAAGSTARDDGSMTQSFLQSWHAKFNRGSTLPHSLKNMLKVAHKYNVQLNPILPSDSLKASMPAWHHIGTDNARKTPMNDIWAKCQRQNHKIKTVRDLTNLATEALPQRHKTRKNCACQVCAQARQKGCKDPNKCKAAALKTLNSLQPKWDPRQQEQNDGLENDNTIRPEVWFNPCVRTNHIEDGFRVFTEPEKTSQLPAVRMPQPQQLPEETVVVHINGTSTNENDETAKAAYIVWYGDGDDHNLHAVMPEGQRKSTAAEAMALLQAAKQNMNTKKLVIKTKSDYILHELTKYLTRREDEGWIATPNDNILRPAIAHLRARGGTTALVKPDEADITKIRELVTPQLENLSIPEMNLDDIPPAFQVTGARLQSMTQSLLYRGILKYRKLMLKKQGRPEQARRKTMIKLDITRHAVGELTETLPDDPTIWRSIRNKAISRNIRAYLWLCMHDAHKCGEYWLDKRNYEQRAMCRTCDMYETMEHILTECSASGQQKVWELTSELLALKSIPWSVERTNTWYTPWLRNARF